MIGCIGSFTWLYFRRWTSQVACRYVVLTSSEDDLIRFEQEIAEISADRDAVEKARLTLLEDYEKLKADAVFSSLYILTLGSTTKITRIG
jgi:hypothetical protein